MIEKNVCSLELSKKLNELGLKQTSLFYWDWHSDTCYAVKFAPYSCPGMERYSAYTVAELGMLLPKELWHPHKHKPLICRPANRLCHWVVYYDKDTWFEENNEADARAKMLIHLIENKIMEVPK